MRALLKNGADANLKDHAGRVALYGAISLNDIEMMKILAPNTNMRILTNDGQSLMGAAYTTEAWNILVGRGAKLCGRFEDDGAWVWQMLRFNEFGTSKNFALAERLRNSILTSLEKYKETKRPDVLKNVPRSLILLRERFAGLQLPQKAVDSNNDAYTRYIDQANSYGQNVYGQIIELAPKDLSVPQFHLEALPMSEPVKQHPTIETKINPDGEGK